MRRFQELFDHRIQEDIGKLIATLQKRPVPEAIDSTLATLGTLNMLNTRYIIYNPEAPPLVNKYETGNAWFVDSVIVVPDADAEIEALARINPARIALVDIRFGSMLEGLKMSPDTSDHISLTEYRANYLKYVSTASSEKLAVFSEVYYDRGWQAYVDDKPVSHMRANYLLRALRVPAGRHTLEFKFHPKSYFIGEKVSLASSLLLVLMILGVGYREWRKKKGVMSDE
jgi:hypothetical protein